MKLLFFTDSHLRGSSPINRKDTLNKTLMAKLSEVVNLANDYGVDFVLHGGDFFDTPNPALSIVADYLQVLQGLEAPLYVVAGNHDMYGGNMTTLSRSVLGFIGRMGIINLLTEPDSIRLEAGGIRAYIKGSSYHLDMDRRPRHLDYVLDKDQESDITVHMIHGMLLAKQEIPGDHTLIDDVLDTGAELVLAGHYHLGFGEIVRGGSHFVNPGALVRLSNHVREMERQVKVALIDLSGGGVSCQFIPLGTAGPGDEVLDRTRAEEMEMRLLALDKFTREVREATELRRWDVAQIINDVAQIQNIEESVRREALRRIALAEEALGGQSG
ncbi:MAG: serine/threonine protein phosphatase [Syntrophomonadaceae bacterium]|nr:serine/threonine protein phosphatase [Syntrophomonadaceae bacterium]